MDKKTYVAPGGWQTYRPESPRAEEPGHKVKLVNVRLLTSQSDAAARTDVASLAAFIKEAERLAEASLGPSGKAFEVMVQVTCSQAGHVVKLAFEGDAPQAALQAYYDALVAAKKVPVRSDEVSFEMRLSVSP